MVVTAIGFGLVLNWDAIPGTFYKDRNGFPHGTGTTEYKYDDGSLMLKEWYYRGLIYKATWFKPDGTELATETFDKKSGGVGYYLRQDGTIRSKHTFEYDARENLYSGVDILYYDKTGRPVPDAVKPID